MIVALMVRFFQIGWSAPVAGHIARYRRSTMIHLTRFSQIPMLLNSDLIEHVETTPDTVIFLTNGQKFMVRETAEQVVQRIIDFRRSILTGSLESTSRCTATPISSSHESDEL